MKDIGKRLKEFRESLGMDQQNFARSIGLSARDTISKWERGLHYPSADILALLHNNFFLNTNWLLSGEGEMLVGAAAPAATLDRDLLRQILAGVDQGLALRRQSLDPDKKAELITLLYDHYAKLREAPDAATMERYLKLVA